MKETFLYLKVNIKPKFCKKDIIQTSETKIGNNKNPFVFFTKILC